MRTDQENEQSEDEIQQASMVMARANDMLHTCTRPNQQGAQNENQRTNERMYKRK